MRGSGIRRDSAGRGFPLGGAERPLRLVPALVFALSAALSLSTTPEAGAAATVQQAFAAGRAPQQTGLRCQLCHGQPELLRQQTDSPERAERMLVPPAVLGSSAHGDMTCAECHAGFGAFPHPREGTITEGCGSCHAAADSAWSAGAHAPSERAPGEGSGTDAAGGGPRTTAACSDCHGVHDVLPVGRLEEEEGVRGMNARCVDCHATAALPDGAPHADSVACHACHRPHDVRHVEAPESAVAPARQASTCGACHESVASEWVEDVHGSAVTAGDAPEAAPEGGDEQKPSPPSCTTCHGQHGMTRLAVEAAAGPEVSRCRDCHEEYADTFGDSYHGQAVSLGSPAAASCADCHTGHSIHSASNPRSSVAPANLIETCGTCHPQANASFVEFEPHADPHDRDKNPVLYWTYRFMTFLLVSVLGVFGLHTLLWILRIGVARVRGEETHAAPRERDREDS